jgi:hypothetical protein
LVTKIGYFAPFVIATPCLVAVGTGLLTTLQPNSGSDKWIGFQFLTGFGQGLGMQLPSVAAQVVLANDDVPMGVSIMFFARGLGGSVLLCVAQNVFIRELISRLVGVGMSAASAGVIAGGVGATDLRNVVPAADLPGVIEAYNGALTRTFFVAVGVAAVAIIPALGFEWRSVKEKKGVDAVQRGEQPEKAEDNV